MSNPNLQQFVLPHFGEHLLAPSSSLELELTLFSLGRHFCIRGFHSLREDQYGLSLNGEVTVLAPVVCAWRIVNTLNMIQSSGKLIPEALVG
jgi:hypothetical protein